MISDDHHREASGQRPAPVVAWSVLVLVASSSIVLFEPAPCDLLFPPVVALTLIMGHAVSPLRLPTVFLGSVGLFALANYASVLPAWAWDLRYTWFYLAVTLYLLAYSVFIASFLGRSGAYGATVLRDGYLLGAAITSGIGLLAALRVLPNSEIFFRDASMLRIQSTFKDPNVFGPFLVGGVLLGLASMAHEERVKLRHLAVVGLSVVGVTLSFSRGAWINLAVALLAYVAMEVFLVRSPRASRRLAHGLAFLSPLLVGAVALLLATTDLGSYLLERLSLQSYDSDRFANQLLSLELAERSVFGIGPGQYTAPRFLQDPHNVYLRVLVENGVVGLIAFVALLGTSLFYGLAGVLRRGPLVWMHTASVSVVLGIAVESLVIDTLHWRHLFFFLALPVGVTLFERTVEMHAEPPHDAALPHLSAVS